MKWPKLLIFVMTKRNAEKTSSRPSVVDVQRDPKKSILVKSGITPVVQMITPFGFHSRTHKGLPYMWSKAQITTSRINRFIDG